MHLKHEILRLLNLLGAPFGISLIKRSDATVARRGLFLSREKIDLVIDVGAATGQYGKQLRAGGYSGRIVSFEPLPESYNLLSRASSKDPLWSAYQLALGDTDTTGLLNRASNHNSSSFLEMTDSHLAGAPSVRMESSLGVKVLRLDNATEAVGSFQRCMLKVDTQGFEDRVLAGAAGLLGKTRLLELELSLAPLYKGALQYLQTIDLVARWGFEPIWFERGFQDQTTGRLLQIDAIFGRQ